MSSKPSPIRNTLTHWGGFMLSAVIGFLLSPVIVRELGDSAYGIWVLIASMIGYLGLLDLGVRGAVVRYIARFHAQGDHASASAIASTALALFTGLGLLAVLGAAILALGLPVFFHDVPAEYVPEARLALVIGGCGIAVNLVGGVYGGIIGGLQRFDLTNTWGIASNIVRSGLVYWAVTHGYGIVALASISLYSVTVFAVVNWRFVRRLYPEITLRRGLAERKWVSTIFSFGFFSVLIHASGVLINQADAIVIAAFLPVAQVTFFSIGATLVQHANAVQRGVTFMIPPMIAALQAKGSTEGLQRTILRAARALSMVLLPVAATFVIRGSTFIGLWMGPQYAEVSGWVLLVLSLRMWFGAGMAVLANALYGLNRHRALVPVLLGEAVANLAMSVALVRPLGVVGVALGTTVPSLLLLFAYNLPRLYHRELGIGIGIYARQVWARTFVAVVPFALATWYVERAWPARGVAEFFLQMGAILPLAAIGAWFFAIDEEDRVAIRARLRRQPRSAA